MGPGLDPSAHAYGCVAACQHRDWLGELPDGLLQQHVLPKLGPLERKALRACDSRLRVLVNNLVKRARVTAADLEPAAQQPATPFAPTASAAAEQPAAAVRLGGRFPCLRSLIFADSGHVTLDEGQLWGFLESALSQLPELCHLDFKQCHHVGAGVLEKLLGSCPSLVSLRPSRWTDTAALMRLARFEQLQVLDLGDADVDVITVDDVGLAALVAGGLPNLTTLNLERCRWLSDGAFKCLGRLQGLRRLNLRRTDVGPSGLAAVAQLEQLEELNLMSCRMVDDTALGWLSSAPRLSKLILADTCISNTGLRHCSSLPALAHLDLGPRFEVDDEGLSHLGRCDTLRYLAAGSFNLTSGWAAAEAGWTGRYSRAAGRKLQPPLEHLSFGGTFANKGLQHLFPVPSLTSLHVQGIDSVTDVVLRTLTRQTSLQRLSLRSGYSLTEQGLEALRQLPHLKELSVSACPAISNTCLAAFVSAHVRSGALLPGVATCPFQGCVAGPQAGEGGMRRCSSY